MFIISFGLLFTLIQVCCCGSREESVVGRSAFDSIILPLNGSCSGLCGALVNSDSLCFCDTFCTQFQDCCSDYNELCGGSCERSCGDQLPFCDCTNSCKAFGDCCPDRKMFCPVETLQRNLGRFVCDEGSHRMDTNFGSEDLKWFQFFIRPNNKNDQTLSDALKDNPGDNIINLEADECFAIAPTDIMQFRKGCLETRNAEAITITVYHENGIYTKTKTVRNPEFWNRKCFRITDRLSHISEMQFCFELAAGATSLELRGVEGQFCHTNDLMLRNYAI